MKRMVQHVGLSALTRARDEDAERVSLALDGADDGSLHVDDALPGRGPITPSRFGMLLAGFIVVKAAAIAGLGQDAYGAAVRTLQRGTVIERAGAFLLVPDIVSHTLAREVLAPR
jgi:hypothetical protein